MAATFAWSAVFLLAGVTATLAALWIKKRCAGFNPALGVVAMFLAAFVSYEGTFIFATLLSGSGLYVYAPSIVLRIFEVNAVLFGGLLLTDRVAVAFGLVRSHHHKTIQAIQRR
jgi:hypothetical protein